MPFERDEGEFAYMARLMLRGIPPYLTAYNMKLPGIYAAYALIMTIFGQTIRGVHLGLLLVNVGAIALVFLIARRLLDSHAAAAAAVGYALMSVSESVLGLAAHATHFVVLPALGGLLLLLKARRSDRSRPFLASGLLLGLGFTMKQPGIFFVLFGALYLIWIHAAPLGEGGDRRVQWGRLCVRLSFFTLGAVIPFAICCWSLYYTGAFGKFWFWTMTFPRVYSLKPSLGLQVLRQTIGSIIGPSFPIWALAGVGLLSAFWDPRVRREWPFLAGFALFSACAVTSSFYFRNHYFVMLLPAIAILAGAAVSSGRRLMLGMGQKPMLALLPALIFTAACGYAIIQQREIFFTLSPRSVCREVYGSNPFLEAIEIGRYLKAHTKPGEPIAVLGSEAEIYFYADRPAATGYIYMYSLMDPQRYAASMQKEMIREIEKARPKYVVWVNVQMSWLARPESETLLFDWWLGHYGPEHYEKVGLIEIMSADWTDYTWGAESRDYQPSSPAFLYVHRRKG